MIENCKSKLRHPRPCKFFKRYGKCKFGKDCSFLHTPSKNLEKEIESLKNELKQKDVELIEVKNKLHEIEKKVDTIMRHQSNVTETINVDPKTDSTEETYVKDDIIEDQTVGEIECQLVLKLYCDLCNYESTSSKGLNIHKGVKHKENKKQRLNKVEETSDTAISEKEEIIQSKLEAYCPECDIIFRCKELLLYRNHCKVAHNWLCCNRSKNGEGCDYATSTKDDFKEHTENCDYI